MITIEEVFANCSGIHPPTKTQLEYSTHVMKSMLCSASNNGGEILIEAETGVGKTLGYLVPMMLTAATKGGRGIVSTYTKSLQKQVVRDAMIAVTGIEKATGVKLKVARLIGKRNFFDRARVESFLESAKADNKPESVILAWSDLIDWLESPESSGEIDDWIEDNGALPENIQASLLCVDSLSTNGGSARHAKMVEDARGADILVTNHAILCLAASSNRESIFHGETNEKPIFAVIADEGDRLVDAARSLVVEQAPLNRAVSVAGKLHEVTSSPNAKDLKAAFLAMRDYAATLYGRIPDAILIEALQEKVHDDMRGMYLRIRSALRGDKEWESLISRTPETHDLYSDLDNYVNALEIAFGDKHSSIPVGAVLHYSPDHHYPSISLSPIYPARVVSRAIDYWRRDDKKRTSDGAAFIVTSATISGSGARSGNDQFWEMKSQMGIFDKQNSCAHLHQSFAPIKFGNIERIVLADPSVPKPYDGFDSDLEVATVSDEWVEYIAKLIKKASSSGGYTLVLANSYHVASKIEIALQHLQVVCTQKTRKERMESSVKRMLANESGVLVTPTGWEGLDARSYGFCWKNVVLAQIPMSRTDDAYRRVLVDYFVKRGKTVSEAEGIVYGEVTSSAFRKMKQGVGRGIRSVTDSFSLWIGDPRMPVFGSATETDEVIPSSVNKTLGAFRKVIPSRFTNVPTAIFLKGGTMLY